MKKIFLFTLSLFLFGSCIIHLNPRIKSEDDFSGIQQSFVNDTAYCVIIHGVGYKDTNYADDLIKNISDNLLGECVQKHDTTLQQMSVFKHVRFNDKGVIKFYTIRWTHLTQQYKDSLLYYENGMNLRRSWLNRRIKNKTVIDQISDLLNIQKKEVLDTVMDFLDVAMTDIANSINLQKKQKINIISSSLGSSIVMKYLMKPVDYKMPEPLLAMKQKKLGKSRSDIEKAYIKERKQLDNFKNSFFRETLNDDQNRNEVGVKTGLNLFMLTNQINLMNGTIANWGCDDGYDDRCFDTVNTLALRNPNDVLCYYLPPEAMKLPQCSLNRFKTVNAYYWNFILGNGIKPAHTKPFKLKKIAKVISYGSTKEGDSYYWVKVKGK